MKLDILVFAAHPDDAELACGGTILAQIAKGYKVGIIDLTRGELGTRGTAEIRSSEAATAAKILKVSVRENLEFADGFFVDDKEHQLEVVKKIRQYQPEIVFANAIYDRHPDHGRASKLVSNATFLAGLAKVPTAIKGEVQLPWRPKNIYHYIQSNHIKPDFVVDISEFIDQKMQAIAAFASQFYDPNNNAPDTFISSPEFMKFLTARSSEMGQPVGFKHGEGFTVEKIMGINDVFDLM
jgi:bacillithiol biosynthesis deacetylase BshB1